MFYVLNSYLLLFSITLILDFPPSVPRRKRYHTYLVTLSENFSSDLCWLFPHQNKGVGYNSKVT